MSRGEWGRLVLATVAFVAFMFAWGWLTTRVALELIRDTGAPMIVAVALSPVAMFPSYAVVGEIVRRVLNDAVWDTP